MYIDPTIISWLLIGAASLAAFMIGKSWNDQSKEEIIENTIEFLIENNMVKAVKSADGEWEILELDEN